MPYIKQTDRDRLDPYINALAENINNEARAGELNYTINQLMLKIVGQGKYSDINELIGALECAKLEFYRRKAVPYEDEKAKENGDLPYHLNT